MSVELVAPKIV